MHNLKFKMVSQGDLTFNPEGVAASSVFIIQVPSLPQPEGSVLMLLFFKVQQIYYFSKINTIYIYHLHSDTSFYW